MMRIAPSGGEIATYHQLGDRTCKALGKGLDFSRVGAFAQIEAVLDAYTPEDIHCFDEIVVDEGQDFQESWINNLLRFLRPAGRAWLLEDPMQNLYGRSQISKNAWVSIRSDINYRTPKVILDTLNTLLPLTHHLEAGSPLTGHDVEIISYSDTRDMIAKTICEVTNCINLGFKSSDIAVITYRGRENSKFTPFDRLGPYSLFAPTGQYDILGNSIFTEGDLLLDSIHRFKGQAAPCIVLTEIDFETLDDSVVRRIFVGATRATMKLSLLLSERSARILTDRMGIS